MRSRKLEEASFAMTKGWQETRATFRHGNLPEALLEAALSRVEAEGAELLSLRELARDIGVNHRAVYRHFPDKLSLVARVAEEGGGAWHDKWKSKLWAKNQARTR
jgi:AcrR family transcriptional regulator